MSCQRCGNKKWKELFPYCDMCDMCLECNGSGQENFSPVICKICQGKGYTVKKEEMSNVP